MLLLLLAVSTPWVDVADSPYPYDYCDRLSYSECDEKWIDDYWDEVVGTLPSDGFKRIAGVQLDTPPGGNVYSPIVERDTIPCPQYFRQPDDEAESDMQDTSFCAQYPSVLLSSRVSSRQRSESHVRCSILRRRARVRPLPLTRASAPAQIVLAGTRRNAHVCTSARNQAPEWDAQANQRRFGATSAGPRPSFSRLRSSIRSITLAQFSTSIASRRARRPRNSSITRCWFTRR